MADNSAGKIVLDIVGNQKPLENTINNLGNSLRKPFQKLGTTIAGALSTAAIISFAKCSIENAAAVNAANSQLTQTFGELESAARSAMSSIAKESGIVETRLQGVGTSIYAFAKTSGMDSVSALNMMQEALKVTADSAAYYDRSLEETAESLKSFLKGNYANDAALGLSCTETTRNAAANKLYGKSFMELSEAQKQLTLLQMVKDANALSGAMGQAAREADGWENVTGNLKEAWKQFQAVVGQPILKIATAVVKQLTGALEKLTVYATAAVNSLSKLFGWDTSSTQSNVEDTAESIAVMSDSAGESAENIETAAKAAEKLKKVVAGFDQLNILDSGDSEDDTSGTDTGTVTAPMSVPAPDTSESEKAIDNLSGKLDKLKKKLEEIYKSSGLKRFADNFKKQISKINFNEIRDNFRSIINNLSYISKAWLPGFQKIFSSVSGCFGMIFGELARTQAGYLETLSGGLAQWLEKDKNKIAGFITTVSDDISGGVDNITECNNTIFDALNESMDRMRPQTENAIVDLLSGFSNFGMSVISIISNAFNTATGVISKWAKKNKVLIGKTFDNFQDIVNEAMSGVGKVFSDIGNTLSSWWYDSGADKTFENICKIFTDLGTAAMNLFNNSIKPVIDKIGEYLSSMWDSLRPVIANILDLLKSAGDFIVMIWNQFIKPIVDELVDAVLPVLMGAADVIMGLIQGLFDAICGIINGIIKFFSGLLDFITGIFTGDWGKAWEGIKKIFSGIWDAIYGVVKGIAEAIANTFKGLCEIIIGALQSAWAVVKNLLLGVWEGIKNIFSPVVDFFKNLFIGAWEGIKSAWSSVGNFFSGIWDGIKNAFSNVTDWFKNVFSGAWQAVKNVFSAGGKIFDGIKDGILNAFKVVVNGIIDGINWVIAQPFNGINAALQGIKGVNILGLKPFDWVNTIDVPQIPKLAKGGLVTAPTLALVGDNKGASHDPEVVAPLSKLESMMNSDNSEIIRLLLKIIALLEDDEVNFYNVLKIDGEELENKLSKIRRRKQRRYGGAVY